MARQRHEICLAAVLLRVDRGRIGIVSDVVAFGDQAARAGQRVSRRVDRQRGQHRLAFAP